VASPNSKDELRREAYLLSKLQSVWGWRGSIVDLVIKRKVLTSLKAHQHIDMTSVVRFARDTFDRQLEFARRHRLREHGMAPSLAGDDFAALYAYEYEGGIGDDELARAWEDIEQSLIHLLEMDQLHVVLDSAFRVIPQRNLSFPHFDVSVRAVPDMIAFFSDRPPLIADWKVHSYGNLDARLQLATYAVALFRTKPHVDFPVSLLPHEPTDVGLMEVQLLSKQQREYSLCDQDITDIDNYIAETSSGMLLALTEEDGYRFRPFDFPVTGNPEMCQRCPFRSLCWRETTQCQDLRQMSFL